MKKTLLKISAVLICVTMLFALSSCGGKSNTSATRGRAPGIYFDLVRSDDAKGVLKMKTNLSNGVKVTVLVCNQSTDYSKETEAEVTTQGTSLFIITDPFTNDDGSTILDGSYTIKIQSKRPSEQSKEVQKSIGDKGQKLVAAGNNVFNDNGEYVVRVVRTVTVKDGVFQEKDK